MNKLHTFLENLFPNLYFSWFIKKHDKEFASIKDYKAYTEKRYFDTYGVKLNLDNPETFYDKVNYLKLFREEKNPEILIDKVLVKKYLEDLHYEKYAAKMVASFTTFESFIDFILAKDHYYQPYVIKLNHTSGDVFFHIDGKWKNKYGAKISKRFVYACLSKKLKFNHYHLDLEKIYDRVVPQILVEEYLPSVGGSGLDEFKFFCNNGEIKMMNIIFGRQTGNHVKEAFTTADLKLLPVYQNQGLLTQEEIYRPECFDEMVEFVKKTAKGKLMLRVDLMTNGKEFNFCEFTYYDCAGFNIFKPLEQNKVIGDMFDISEAIK